MGYIWYLVVGFLALPGPSCSNSDNLALLLDTLKVIQRAVCTDETVALACPRGTTISILVAQYGKAGEEQGCPMVGNSEAEHSKICKLPNAMQYSLLQTVVEACQKKPQCKFSTLPMAGVVDPCPMQSKYVEVSYKCRPYEFRSRTGCEGEMIKLSCNPHSRIAIFDAQYGRTAFETISCPQTQGVLDETCETPHAVKTVLQLCLGKRRCQIAANSRTFNSSCNLRSRPYLKVVYTCVPLGILSEKYESPAERDEISSSFDNSKELFDESEEVGEKWGEPNADRALQPPLYEDYVPPTRPESEITTIIHPKKNVDNHESKLEPQHGNSLLLLCISLGLIILIIIIGAFITVRCYINRRNNTSKNGDMYTTEAPNVFNDAFSDIDNDADISHISGTFNDPIHPDMILYKNIPGSRGTLRAMKPLCTIYPSNAEGNMYGNVDYVPSHGRDTAPRFTRSRSNEEEMESNVMTSPRSLGAHSTNFYYG